MCSVHDPGIAQAVDELVQALTKADTDKYTRATATLNGRLQKNWKQSYEAALDGALRVLRRTPTPELTEAGINGVLQSLEVSLGVPLAGSVAVDIQKVVDLTYESAAKDIATTDYLFSLTDERAIDFLGKNNTYWIGSYYGNNLSAEVAKVGQVALSEGLTKRQAGLLFQNTFRDVFKDRTRAYWNGFATNVVTQGREFGHVGGYEFAGTEYYRIVAIIDDLTSPICLKMHNTVYPAKRAVQLRDAIMDIPTPEGIKSVNKWYTPDELEGTAPGDYPPAMSLPPYHFNCRTRSVHEK